MLDAEARSSISRVVVVVVVAADELEQVVDFRWTSLTAQCKGYSLPPDWEVTCIFHTNPNAPDANKLVAFKWCVDIDQSTIERI